MALTLAWKGIDVQEHCGHSVNAHAPWPSGPPAVTRLDDALTCHGTPNQQVPVYTAAELIEVPE